MPVFDARAWLTPTEKYFGGVQVTAYSKCTKPLRHKGLYSFDSGETKFPIAADGTVATTKYKVGGEVRGTAKLKGKLNGNRFTGTVTGKFRSKLLGRCTLKTKFKTTGKPVS